MKLRPGIARVKRLVAIVALAALAVAAVGVAAIAALRPYPPDRLRPGAGAAWTITDRRGQPLRIVPAPGAAGGRWVTLDQIAPEVALAVVGGEDHRFFTHGGVDGR